MDAFIQMSAWPVTAGAAAVIHADKSPRFSGEQARVFPLASVTKALFSYVVLVAVEEGTLAFDQPVGPPGSTVAHLLSHSSGLAAEEPVAGSSPSVLADVGQRRIYSNYGFETLGAELERSSAMTTTRYFAEALCGPLNMSNTRLDGSPGHGASSTIEDLARFGQELLNPTLISRETLGHATQPFLGELVGVLPGYGRQDPNPWGLGFEIRGHKSPHWTGRLNSPSTFGHFGRSGTFLWLDPNADAVCIVLTDRQFGPWAVEAWPVFSDAVLDGLGADPP